MSERKLSENTNSSQQKRFTGDGLQGAAVLRPPKYEQNGLHGASGLKPPATPPKDLQQGTSSKSQK